MSWYTSYKEDAKLCSTMLALHDYMSFLSIEEEKETRDLAQLQKSIKDSMSVDESRASVEVKLEERRQHDWACAIEGGPPRGYLTPLLIVAMDQGEYLRVMHLIQMIAVLKGKKMMNWWVVLFTVGHLLTGLTYCSCH